MNFLIIQENKAENLFMLLDKLFQAFHINFHHHIWVLLLLLLLSLLLLVLLLLLLLLFLMTIKLSLLKIV